MKRISHAFTLVEIAVVTAIIGVLSMILLPSLVDVMESKRLEAERSSLAVLEDDIKRSFQDVDWSRNLAAFPGAMPDPLTAQFATVFGECTPGASAADGAWFVKLARMRGVTPTMGAPITAEQQKALFDIAYNSSGNPRILIAGPVEPHQQRYLLLSLVAPATKGLVIPASDGSAGWFDAVWNADWENESASLPQEWLNRLSEPQRQAWLSGRGQTTNLHYLVVRRLVQPKYSITLNNAHPAYSGWLEVSGRTEQDMNIKVGEAPKVFTGNLAGALVVFRRGTSGPEAEVFRIHLNDNTAFTLQSGGP